MNKMTPAAASNNVALKQIQLHNPKLASRVPLLRNAYLKYHAEKGHPADLQPVGLNSSESEELHFIYKGETEKYRVRWIGEYRSAPEQAYCPLCGAPNTSQLEHYLPRAHYPEYTVLSWNLVPTCAVCNPKRGHHAHTPNESVPLVHPYYDGKLLTQPLFSAIIVRPFVAASFVPVPSRAPFAPDIVLRLERQIRLCFDIDKFNRWLTNTLWKQEHAELSGLPTQSEALKRIMRRFKIRRATTGMNSWDTIFFRALLNDGDAIRWLRETPCSIAGTQ